MKMHIEIVISASADDAWKVLGEGYGNISEWSSSLSSSSLEGGLQVGGVRSCESSEGFGPFKAGVVEEKLTVYDPSARIFEYVAISGIPGFIERVSNHWSIHSVDENNCVVHSDVAMKFRGIARVLAPIIGPLMKLAVRSDLKRFTGELEYRISNGRPHPDAKN